MSAHISKDPLALVGSGEYLEVMADIEAELIEGRPPRYVQLATAAAPEAPAGQCCGRAIVSAKHSSAHSVARITRTRTTLKAWSVSLHRAR